MGNTVEPILFFQNEQINLHPIVMIASILVWYIVWGIPGAILAVPVMTTTKIIA